MLTGPDGRYQPTEADLARRPVNLNEGRSALSAVDSRTGQVTPIEILELRIPVSAAAMEVVEGSEDAK